MWAVLEDTACLVSNLPEIFGTDRRRTDARRRRRRTTRVNIYAWRYAIFQGPDLKQKFSPLLQVIHHVQLISRGLLESPRVGTLLAYQKIMYLWSGSRRGVSGQVRSLT